jgi:hypothetical protein
MILLFKACCESRVHYLCHYVVGFLVTLDLRTKPMYSQKACRNYCCLHNIKKTITLLQIKVFFTMEIGQTGPKNDTNRLDQGAI